MRNVLFAELSEKIISLTEQVEQLIVDKNEETCSALLLQRHILLVELHENVGHEVNIESDGNNADNVNVMETYHQFLRDIQQRDAITLTHLNSAQKDVAKALTLQITGTKAVSAYKNVIID